MNYMIALWVTYTLKWAEIIPEVNLNWLLTSSHILDILGYLNTIVILSLSVVFAVVGAFHILRKSGGNKTTRWWGMSSIFLSTHFIIYVLYCANTVGMWRFIQYGELWTIPLLGLGVYLLLKKPKVKLMP
jgi:hypothetical protein